MGKIAADSWCTLMFSSTVTSVYWIWHILVPFQLDYCHLITVNTLWMCLGSSKSPNPALFYFTFWFGLFCLIRHSAIRHKSIFLSTSYCNLKYHINAGTVVGRVTQLRLCLCRSDNTVPFRSSTRSDHPLSQVHRKHFSDKFSLRRGQSELAII